MFHFHFRWNSFQFQRYGVQHETPPVPSCWDCYNISDRRVVMLKVVLFYCGFFFCHIHKGSHSSNNRDYFARPSHKGFYTLNWDLVLFHGSGRPRYSANSVDELDAFASIFDTGILANHLHFRNIKQRTSWTSEDTLNDNLGHGTFVGGLLLVRMLSVLVLRQILRFMLIVCSLMLSHLQVSYTSWFLDVHDILRTYRSSLPVPCSYMFGPESFAAPSTSACFMLVGFRISLRLLSGMTLTSRHTTPATTGLATLVPERLLQPVLILDPMISRPYATISGFTRPHLHGKSLLALCAYYHDHKLNPVESKKRRNMQLSTINLHGNFSTEKQMWQAAKEFDSSLTDSSPNLMQLSEWHMTVGLLVSQLQTLERRDCIFFFM